MTSEDHSNDIQLSWVFRIFSGALQMYELSAANA